MSGEMSINRISAFYSILKIKRIKVNTKYFYLSYKNNSFNNGSANLIINKHRTSFKLMGPLFLNKFFVARMYIETEV